MIQPLLAPFSLPRPFHLTQLVLPLVIQPVLQCRKQRGVRSKIVMLTAPHGDERRQSCRLAHFRKQHVHQYPAPRRLAPRHAQSSHIT
eukprot:12996917-Alexandrium_andersonii.AAC.1